MHKASVRQLVLHKYTFITTRDTNIYFNYPARMDPTNKCCDVKHASFGIYWLKLHG